MSALPIRARVTLAFALAMALVLAGAGLFVYLRVRADLDEAVDAGLRDRAAALVAGEADESFAQLLSPDGGVLRAAGGARRAVLAPAELPEREVLLERQVPGIEGTTRVLARPADRPGGPVVVVGQSLEDRDEALGSLVAAFALGGPLAVALASLLGYGLAATGLAPMEAMRARAAEVSLAGEGARLPLPAAHDEVRRLGETLNAMLDRLRTAYERERRFVADASHELRTPVAVVKTELEGALRLGGHAPAVREALVAALEECDHLAQLAEDLLVLARAGDGQLPVRRERVAARALLDAVRTRFADRAAEHGRRLAVEAPAQLELSVDPLRLRQALGNLVDNALRHGCGDVVLSARGRDGGVELAVADEGPGVPEALAPTAFERFTRGDGVRTRGGSGLGLAIVRAIPEAHDGRAEIAAGATVRVWLPAQGDLSSPA